MFQLPMIESLWLLSLGLFILLSVYCTPIALAQQAVSGCTAVVRYDNAWDGGVIASVAIFNNTANAMSDWSLMMTWDEADGASITDAWGANVAISGTAITASAAVLSGTIAPNDVQTMGFTIMGDNLYPTTPKPAAVQVDGAVCRAQTQPILVDSNEQGGRQAAEAAAQNNECIRRFLAIYDALHDPVNGYFDDEGLPYHAVEQLIVDTYAPAHGHVSTSRAVSYMLLLEAAYGKISDDWSNFEKAYAILEHTIIPDASQQPTWYTADHAAPAAVYAPQNDQSPAHYPAVPDPAVTVGTDPLHAALNAHYNNNNSAPMYTMHRLLDVDNIYAFGESELGITRSVYIDTFRRGAAESVWETLPHPAYETRPGGILDQFIDNGLSGKPQWRYTNAPEADGRVAEAFRLAQLWEAPPQQLNPLLAKGAKMVDHIRYSMFDKHFMPIGCLSNSAADCTNGEYDGTYPGAHDLLGRQTAWGAPLDPADDTRFLFGSSDVHISDQDPRTAYVVSRTDLNSAWVAPGADLIGLSPAGVIHYGNSFVRQMELYMWLQSDKPGFDPEENGIPAGAFAGGVTNSVDGTYNNVAYSGKRFYGMAYDDSPVHDDPHSNISFDYQVRTAQRLVMTLVEMANNGDTFDEGAYPLYLDTADDWVNMAISTVRFDDNGQAFILPARLDWGDPAVSQPSLDWAGGDGDIEALTLLQDANVDLQMNIMSYNQDVGAAAGLARTLLGYAQLPQAAYSEQASAAALRLIDALWYNHWTRDDHGTVGMAATEYRADYLRFWNETPINPISNYEMGNGQILSSGATFDDTHWFYEQSCAGIASLIRGNDDHRTCIQYCELHDAWTDVNGDASADQRPSKMIYHRFSAQVENAVALIEADAAGYMCGTMPTAPTSAPLSSNPQVTQTMTINTGPSQIPDVCASLPSIGDPVPLEPLYGVLLNVSLYAVDLDHRSRSLMTTVTAVLCLTAVTIVIRHKITR